jgi:hypothetical protein
VLREFFDGLSFVFNLWRPEGQARRPGLVTRATPAAALLTVGTATRNPAPKISRLPTIVITRPAIFQGGPASCDSDCDTEHPYLVR